MSCGHSTARVACLLSGRGDGSAAARAAARGRQSELRTPLRFVVPPGATALVGRFWPTEFMVFAAGHPILVRAAEHITANILHQAELLPLIQILRCDYGSNVTEEASTLTK